MPISHSWRFLKREVSAGFDRCPRGADLLPSIPACRWLWSAGSWEGPRCEPAAQERGSLHRHHRASPLASCLWDSAGATTHNTCQLPTEMKPSPPPCGREDVPADYSAKLGQALCHAGPCPSARVILPIHTHSGWDK